MEKVRASSLLASAAGQSMDDIVAQVRRVNDQIAEISSASAVQIERRLTQVGATVTQLDQVTQQDVALR